MEGETKLETWRRQRAKRRARLQHAELRRKPMAIRPGGNDTTQFPRTVRAVIVPAPEPPPPPPVVPKFVPMNTHRAGSIAYALLYRYWLPNATEPR